MPAIRLTEAQARKMGILKEEPKEPLVSKAPPPAAINTTPCDCEWYRTLMANIEKRDRILAELKIAEAREAREARWFGLGKWVYRWGRR